MPANGIIAAIAKYHQESTSKWVAGIIYMMVVIHRLCTFQIYAMIVFDNLEGIYVSRQHKACPRWLRSCIKPFFGGLTYFIIGGVSIFGKSGCLCGWHNVVIGSGLPLFYVDFNQKTNTKSFMWRFNMFLGCFCTRAGALWNLVVDGLDANFFRP